MKRRAPLKRSAFKSKAPPPRPAKQVDYTPRPRAPAVAVRDSSRDLVVQVLKSEPVSDESYRRLVAALPCIHCGRPGPSQAAHGPTLGARIKASDDDIFPLCADRVLELGCHTLFDQYVLFDAEQRREVAARWAYETRLATGRGRPTIRAAGEEEGNPLAS